MASSQGKRQRESSHEKDFPAHIWELVNDAHIRVSEAFKLAAWFKTERALLFASEEELLSSGIEELTARRVYEYCNPTSVAEATPNRCAARRSEGRADDDALANRAPGTHGGACRHATPARTVAQRNTAETIVSPESIRHMGDAPQAPPAPPVGPSGSEISFPAVPVTHGVAAPAAHDVTSHLSSSAAPACSRGPPRVSTRLRGPNLVTRQYRWEELSLSADQLESVDEESLTDFVADFGLEVGTVGSSESLCQAIADARRDCRTALSAGDLQRYLVQRLKQHAGASTPQLGDVTAMQLLQEVPKALQRPLWVFSARKPSAHGEQALGCFVTPAGQGGRASDLSVDPIRIADFGGGRFAPVRMAGDGNEQGTPAGSTQMPSLVVGKDTKQKVGECLNLTKAILKEKLPDHSKEAVEMSDEGCKRLNASDGQHVAVLGENGTGKTSKLNAMCFVSSTGKQAQQECFFDMRNLPQEYKKDVAKLRTDESYIPEGVREVDDGEGAAAAGAVCSRSLPHLLERIRESGSVELGGSHSTVVRLLPASQGSGGKSHAEMQHSLRSMLARRQVLDADHFRQLGVLPASRAENTTTKSIMEVRYSQLVHAARLRISNEKCEELALLFPNAMRTMLDAEEENDVFFQDPSEPSEQLKLLIRYFGIFFALVEFPDDLALKILNALRLPTETADDSPLMERVKAAAAKLMDGAGSPKEEEAILLYKEAFANGTAALPETKEQVQLRGEVRDQLRVRREVLLGEGDLDDDRGRLRDVLQDASQDFLDCLLTERVQVFVPSEMLKGGTSFLDLPGCNVKSFMENSQLDAGLEEAGVVFVVLKKGFTDAKGLDDARRTSLAKGVLNGHMRVVVLTVRETQGGNSVEALCGESETDAREKVCKTNADDWLKSLDTANDRKGNAKLPPEEVARLAQETPVRCVYPMVHLACTVNKLEHTKWAASDEGQRSIRLVMERSGMHWLLGVAEKLNRDDQIAELTKVIDLLPSLDREVAAALNALNPAVSRALLSWANGLMMQSETKPGFDAVVVKLEEKSKELEQKFTQLLESRFAPEDDASVCAFLQHTTQSTASDVARFCRRLKDKRSAVVMAAFNPSNPTKLMELAFGDRASTLELESLDKELKDAVGSFVDEARELFFRYLEGLYGESKEYEMLLDSFKESKAGPVLGSSKSTFFSRGQNRRHLEHGRIARWLQGVANQERRNSAEAELRCLCADFESLRRRRKGWRNAPQSDVGRLLPLMRKRWAAEFVNRVKTFLRKQIDTFVADLAWVPSDQGRDGRKRTRDQDSSASFWQLLQKLCDHIRMTRKVRFDAEYAATLREGLRAVREHADQLRLVWTALREETDETELGQQAMRAWAGASAGCSRDPIARP